MATVAGVLAKLDDNYVTLSWEEITVSPDDGEPLRPGPVDGLTAQLLGTLGTGGEVTMQGSNDGTNWGTLQDPAGDPIVLTSIGHMMVIASRPLFIRPLNTAGNGATSLDVIVAGTRRGF